MPNPNPSTPGAPDLGGFETWAEVRTFWAPAHESNIYTAAQAPYGGVERRFLGTCLHTPEETADDVESTPWWFQQPAANASTGFYADSDGDIFQMVRDVDFPWAQGTRTVTRPNTVLPRPSWWKPEYASYNTCLDSIEIEGRAASIGRTFFPGSPQFVSTAKLVAWRHHKRGIPVTRERIMGHYELATDRGDPGLGFVWPEFMVAVRGYFDLLNEDAPAPESPDIHHHALKLAPAFKTGPPLL